ISPHIRTRKDRPFDPYLVEEDVRRLTRSGLFVDVKPYYRDVPGGRVVIFEVVERPRIEYVKFVGNEKLKRKLLQRQIDLKEGDALDPYMVADARHKIEDFYHKRGHAKAQVQIVEGDKPGDRGVVFLINEGAKNRILWTSFVGNTIASDGRLRTQIQSKPGFLWFFKGEVNRESIDEDVDRLVAYYRGLGFLRARVGRELNHDVARNWVVLTFVIDEGPRYQIRNIRTVGNEVIDSDQLTADLKLREGQYFNGPAMKTDVSGIQEQYGSIGYVFCNVQPNIRYLEDEARVDLVYEVEEGDRYRVGRINVEIAGEYPHTKITTVLNRLSFKPGDIVDIRELRDSERRLRSSGLFMVDPMRGEMPKIVFSPPALDEESVADRPRRSSSPPGFRGQSPDPDWTVHPAAHREQAAPNDRWIGLTLLGRLLDGPAPEEGPSHPPQQPPPASHVVRFQSPTARSMPSLPSNWPESSESQSATNGYTAPYTQPTRPAYPEPAYTQPAPVYTQPAATAPPDSYGTMPAADYPAAAPAQPGTVAAPAAPPGWSSSPVPATPQPVFGNQFPADPVQSGGQGQLGPPLIPPLEPGPVYPEFPGAFDAATRELDIGVRTAETQTGRLMFGVGINSDAGLIGNIVIDEQNFDLFRFPRGWEDVRNATAFRGAGQRFRAEAMPGTEVQRYMVTFQEPYLLNSDISLSLSGFYYDRRYTEWDEQRVGGRTALGYHFTRNLSGSLSFRGARVTVHNPISVGGVIPADLEDALGKNTLLGFGASLTHDTRDSSFLATEGHLVEAAFEQVIGTHYYPRFDLDLRRYFLLHQRPDGSGRHVLSMKAQFGWTGDDTPIYDHYYAGGFSTLRGFNFRGVTPIDAATGVGVGGEFRLLASVEYMFPITADDMLRAVVFCDTGTVEPKIDQWFSKYRVAPGFGLRVVIPAMGPAPLAFDFAFPVASEASDRNEVFSFFIGYNH
ncbi:MAG: BamA/TamA family outer membrane protein, partial [Thermoguttaceae bacterium]|nr:BamA/TamA family outer membrane protein [Thermoguttaceae bacterium]